MPQIGGYMRSAPSGPESGYEHTSLSGTVAAIGAAGDYQTIAIAVAEAKLGDVATWVVSPTALAAGVVFQGGVCLADGTMTVNATGTKVYAGAALTDFSMIVFRPVP